MEVKIHLKDGATPRFHKAIPVPYAMKEKIEDALKRLQVTGIIEPVNTGVVKDSYPLPRVNDLYAILTGGATFSKLDLSYAYLQLKLDDAPHEYVTINTHRGLFIITIWFVGGAIYLPECSLAYRMCVSFSLTGNTQSEHVANLRLVLSVYSLR